MAPENPCNHPDFAKWFPYKEGAQMSSPVLRLICFHGAGMESSIFTGKGSYRDPSPNPLVEYCLKHRIQLLAVQLPGRGMRMAEEPLPTAADIAEVLFSVLSIGVLDSCVDFAICGHSMGCLCAYEFVQLLIERKAKKPVHLFLSACVSPDLPEALRPWRRSRLLTDPELQEEAKIWGVNEAVFRANVWSAFCPLFRADFPVFDEYKFEHKGYPPLGVNATLFNATRDTKVTRELMSGWEGLLSDGTTGVNWQTTNGEHSFFYDKNDRAEWMNRVMAVLDDIVVPHA